MKQLTPENIRELLSRYMEGESTQEEQRALKAYFGSTHDVPADLLPYAQMFASLEEKTVAPSLDALNRFAEGQTQAPRRRIPLWPTLAAACVAAFVAIILTPPKHGENMAIAYVDGKMLTGEEQAMQMGQEALQEIFSNGNETEQLNELFNLQ